ncbi:MAG: hypothetical protein VX641_03070 [Planctomycetota bacterium]|nr:hypothetical protein [Planctomycetota bacterium]
MRRGHKPTLYELMSPPDDALNSTPLPRDQGTRTVRIPLGFFFLAAGLLVVLLVGAYGFGFYRGGQSMRALEELARQDALERQARMTTVSEVDEPGGGGAPVASNGAREIPGPADLTVSSSPSQEEPAEGLRRQTDPRIPGLNYYVIDHPSRGKASQLVEFCRRYGLDAHQTRTRKGSPKVFILPGYAPGERDGQRFIELRERIQRVGVLWNRQDPGQNSDFSTYYAEKYRPSTS